jgi:SAM-dependent methyltransferase
MDDIISKNRKTWDVVADHFIDASSLPVWGPFGAGSDLDLIPEIKGKTFLEIGCGSGRSIKYLLDREAEKVYGLDFSAVQLKESSCCNAKAVAEGKACFINGNMEDTLDIEPIDVAYSIYGIGWTSDPVATFKNIHSYLKPGGMFVWSWDNTFFFDVAYQNGTYTVIRSYHEEKSFIIQNWKNKGVPAHLIYRKMSSWFRLLRDAGFEIVEYHEPKPKNLDRGFNDPEKYYAIQKADMVPATMIFVCRKK